MGMARGKVGDVVLTRLAGEQVARARNRAPKNPKTTKQMAQRAALATCVEFYTRGVKNLFKFAFESKKPSESDYNAFVRANIGIIPVQSHKSLVENNSVFGPIIMSQGSLTEPEFFYGQNFVRGSLAVAPLPAAGANLTISQLSKAIADHNGLQDGDIITIVAITAKDDELISVLEQAVAVGALQNDKAVQKWIVKQFTLDFSSTAKAETLGIFEVGDAGAGASTLDLSSDVFADLDYTDEYSTGLAVIASRNTASGVKVSTSTMKLGEAAKKSSDLGTSSEWRQYVARTWNTSTSLDVAPENILQGSISANK